MLRLTGRLDGKLGMRGAIFSFRVLLPFESCGYDQNRSRLGCFFAMYFDWSYNSDHTAFITCFVNSLAFVLMNLFGVESESAWIGPRGTLPVRAEWYHKLSLPYVLIHLTYLASPFFFLNMVVPIFLPDVRSGDITIVVWTCYVCMYSTCTHMCIHTRLPDGLPLMFRLGFTNSQIEFRALVMIGSFDESHDRDRILQIRRPSLLYLFDSSSSERSTVVRELLYLTYSSREARQNSGVKGTSSWWRIDKTRHDTLIDGALTERLLCRNSFPFFGKREKNWNLWWWQRPLGSGARV